MKFPNLVYCSPGAHQMPGGSFDYLQVNDEKEYNEAIKNGYFNSPEAALKGDDKPELIEQEDTSAPTREELEQKASELNISFDGRTSDNRLLKKIQETLEDIEDKLEDLEDE